MSEYFYFVDNNCPGIVYRGNEAHMRGLTREGGFPGRLTIERPIVDGCMIMNVRSGEVVSEERWTVRELEPDHFWTWLDERYDAHR